jgi:hypothetical protein
MTTMVKVVDMTAAAPTIQSDLEHAKLVEDSKFAANPIMVLIDGLLMVARDATRQSANAWSPHQAEKDKRRRTTVSQNWRRRSMP